MIDKPTRLVDMDEADLVALFRCPDCPREELAPEARARMPEGFSLPLPCPHVTPPMLEWLEPETPEEQAAFDNYCAVIVRIVSSWTEPLEQEYNPGEINRAPGESSAPRSASTDD